MLAREIFYHFSDKKEGVLTRADKWISSWWSGLTSNDSQVTTDTSGNPAISGTDSVGTTNSGTSTPATSATTADPHQSSYRIPILSRFNGTPSQSNSQSVLNAGLTVTTPRRG